MRFGAPPYLLLRSLESLRISGRAADARHRVRAAAHALQRRYRHVAHTFPYYLADCLEERVPELGGTAVRQEAKGVREEKRCSGNEK